MEERVFDSIQEFFDHWLKVYQATIGSVTDMPIMGPAREKSEKAVKGFSHIANLYGAWLDLATDFQQVFLESMQRTQEQVGATMRGKLSPDKYDELYKMWIDACSETFNEFLKTDHFSSNVGELTSNFTELQKFQKDLLEDNYLKPMNLPTKTELDEINKELYGLRKAVKELASQVKELSEKK